MKRLFAFALLFPSLSLSAFAAAGAEEVYPRTYRVSYLSSHMAEYLILQQCPEGRQTAESCQVLASNDEGLRIRTNAATHQRIVGVLAERDAGPDTHRFQITLVSAGDDAERYGSAIPQAAQRALRDVEAFVPYSSFELIDSGLIRTAGSGRVRLAGPQGQPVEARLRFKNASDPDGVKLLIDSLEVNVTADSLPGTPGEAPQRGPLRAGRLISTSLTIAQDETVVVGTSNIDRGEEALIILITALP